MSSRVADGFHRHWTTWMARPRGVDRRRRGSHVEATAPVACPGCGLTDQRGAPVCRNCGLPIAGSGDPLRGVAPRWFTRSVAGPSTMTSVTGLVLVIALIVIAGTLATSGAGFLRSGGRLGLTVPPSPSLRVAAPAGPSVDYPSITIDTVEPTVTPIAPIEPAVAYSCEDARIRAASKSRWRLEAVRAGSRRGFERVTFQLVRRGKAQRAARVTIRWMSPAEARRTFGLPKFSGQRGLLLTFGGPVSNTDTQLIGEVDLARQRMTSISGIYRFVDFDGRVRAFVAIRDRTCARIRGPGFENEARSAGGARIVLDLGRP